MKNTILLGSLLVSLSTIGQLKVSELMTFTYSDYKVIDYDLESDGIEPIIIYSAGTGYKHEIQVKKWDGQVWQLFGRFPELKNPSSVNLEFYKDEVYAVVRDEDYFSLYKKEGNNWNVYGTKNFATYKQLSHPTLTFFRGEPIIYDKIYGQGYLTMFKYKDGKISEFPIMRQLGDISDDFKTLSNDPDKMIMTWSSGGTDDKFHFFELTVGANNETSQVEITKGLKVKDIRSINNLFYKKSTLYLVYTTNDYTVKVATLSEGATKWEIIREGTFDGTSNHYPADDLSFLALDKERASYNSPLFYHFNGDSWDEGIKIGDKYTEINYGAQMTIALGDYFIIYRDKSEKVVVKRITDL